jgi:hypothetical protein
LKKIMNVLAFMINPYGIIAALCLAGYVVSLGGSFMLDDFVILFNEAGVSNKTFIQLFVDYQHIFARPFGHLLLWASYPILKTNPLGYHVLNLLLFVVICWLFYEIVQKLFKNNELAFLTAVLYALHPINSMLVNYVTVTVIATFVLTMQLSFLCLLKYLDSGQKKFFMSSLIFFLMSLFSHEMSMVYPAYVFCLLYFLREFDWRKAMIFTLPYAGVSGVYFLYRMVFFDLQGQASAAFAMLRVFSVYISSIMALISWYIGKLLFPRDIIFLWNVVIEDNYKPFDIYRFSLLALVILYLIFFRWKKGRKAFALSFFIVGFLPVFVSSYAHFPFVEPMIEPHWFYFSSLGFFILLAGGILWLKQKMTRTFWKYCISLLFVFYFVLLQDNNLQWRTQESYCRFWISQNAANMTPYYGMGQVMLAHGKGAQAIEYFEKGLKVSQRHSAYILADIGYGYFLKGDYRQALMQYEAAIKQEPHYSVTYYYLALLKWRQGDHVGAEQFLLQAQIKYAKSGIYDQELRRLREGQDLIGSYPLFKE